MLIIGSRGSKLALWQAHWVQKRLAGLGHQSRVEVIRTTGDKITDVALSKIGTKGLFTKELEEALLDRTIDLAVHSLKDMPTELPQGLTLAAIPPREDARDAMAGSRLADLPEGSRVGTSSLRRAAQLKLARPELVVDNLRGNLDTRLRKLDDGRYDAIVLASAGLRRLGLEERIAETLPVDVMCPAVGQGALAVECRDEDSPATEACRQLDHALTRAAVTAERALLAALGGGCQVPIGGHGWVEEDRLILRGIVLSPDGRKLVRMTATGPITEARRVGEDLGAMLLEKGAAGILEEVYGGA